MIESMQQMSRWHTQSFMSLPVGDGYETEVTEFDYKDDGALCYNKNGVTVRHWRRSHTMDGASAYRLDWNGLPFVWTGDNSQPSSPKAPMYSSAKWWSTIPHFGP